MSIDKFEGEYWFLSNFYHPCRVVFDGIPYPSSEHAFQAQKTLDESIRLTIAALPRPGMAKKYGHKLLIRPDWEAIKLPLMAEIVEAKFRQHCGLRLQLLDTGEQELIEGNYWNDRYWGVCDGRGENHLGKILMALRDRLKSEE